MKLYACSVIILFDFLLEITDFVEMSAHFLSHLPLPVDYCLFTLPQTKGHLIVGTI